MGKQRSVTCQKSPGLMLPAARLGGTRPFILLQPDKSVYVANRPIKLCSFRTKCRTWKKRI